MILIFLIRIYKTKRINEKRGKKTLTLINAIILPNGRQKVLNALKSGIFLKEKQGKGLSSKYFRSRS